VTLTELKPGRAITVPASLWAVMLLDSSADAALCALFLYAEQAKRWADANYAGRFEIIEVRTGS
jgi:hypothetical protein